MALPRVLSVIPVVVCTLSFPPAVTAQTGSIEGTVVFEGGNQPYPPIRVEAHDPYQGDAFSWTIGWGDADESGNYSITSLPAGWYRVYFNPLTTDRAFRWYPDRAVGNGAQLVEVLADTTTTLDAVTLPSGLTIEGDVSLSPPDAGALSQVSIEAFEASTGERASGGGLDPAGHYTLANLPAGKYILRAWRGNTGYVPEYWPDSIYWSGAMPVEVSVSTPAATGKDFTLNAGTTISGSVLLDGAPLQGASVNAWLQGPTCCFDIWTSTDEAGQYVVSGLPQGTYGVRVQGGVSPGGQYYSGQRWNGRSSFDAGDALVVEAGGRAGIDFSLEPANRTIEGLVYHDANDNNQWDDPEQKLQVGVTVYRAGDGACCEWSGSGPDGAYRIAVPEGQYKVEANPPANLIREYWDDEFFLEDADQVDVTSASATGIDLGLGEGAVVGPGLEGRVVEADGTTGIPGVDVQLSRWSTGSWVTSVRTGPDGLFRFTGLPAGDYRVHFNTGNSNSINDQDYVSERWTRCQIEPGACPEGVIDPNVQKVSYPARTSLGDFRLQAGGSISGTVCVGDVGAACPASDPGLPAGLWVNLESVVSMGPGSQGPPGGQVGSDGGYRIRGVPAPASYRVRVDPWGTGYSQAYYVAATESTPFWSLAMPVQVEIGGHQPSKDLHLTSGGTISGHVYCGADEPIPGIQVNANMNGPGVWYGRGVQTDGNGLYVLDGLPPGDYEVRTDGRGQAGSAGCPNPANETYPSMVPILGTENVPGIDFHLANGTTISGNVQYRVGGVPHAVVNMRVSASDWESGEYVSDDNTDSEGNYTISALPVGRDYRVQVNTRDGHLDPQFWNFVQEAWDDDPTGQGSPVAGGATDVDFELDLGGAISGRVTAEGGTPLTGVNVSAWDYDKNGSWNNANTDQNGFYIIRGLPGARYAVYANPQPRNYVPEYFDDVIGGVPPTPVTVTQHPDTVPITENIDFELSPGVVIRGQVRFGGGLSGIRLVAYQTGPPGGWSNEVVTGSNGEYEIPGVFPGDWRVEVLTLGTEYALERQDRAVGASGFPCSDTTGRTDCVDFDLEPGSTLRFYAYEDKDLDGTCSSSDAVQGVRPRIEFWDTREDVSSTGWWSFQTNEDGEATVSGLPAGRFRVRMQGGDFVTTYYDKALRQDDADPFDLGSQDDETLTFCLVRGKTISGRVFYDRYGDGVQTRNANPDFDEPGIPNVCPRARTPWAPEGSFDYGGNCTDANGDYTITGILPVYPYPGGTPLQYRVWANAQGTPYASEYFDRDPDGSGPAIGQSWWGQAEIVGVDGGNRAGIDLSLGLGGGVEGTVTEEGTGAFLAGIDISVNPFDNESDGFGTRTDASGHYLVTGLAPGSYRVQAQDRSGVYVQEYYVGTYFSNDATPVSVAARVATDDPLASTADFVLGQGGAVEGVVYRDTNGNGSFDPGTDEPLIGANVSADRFNAPNWGITNTNTDVNGHYRLAGLPAGLALRIRVDTPSGTDLVQMYYDGPPNGDQGAVNPNEAAPVTIPAPGTTVSGISFAMVEGGAIEGVVYEDKDASGSFTVGDVLLSNVHVNAERFDSPNWWVAGTNTRGDGTFRLVVPAGLALRVRCNTPAETDLVSVYYDGPANGDRGTAYTDQAVPVTVPAPGATVSAIHFALAEGGVIGGVVYEDKDDSGSLTDGDTRLSNANVCVNRFDPQTFMNCAGTSSDGTYRLAVPAGAVVRVWANAPSGTNLVSAFYDGETNGDRGSSNGNEAAPVTGPAPGVILPISFALRRGGTITGTVTEEGTGAPLSVTVWLWDQSGALVQWQTTDSSGRYSASVAPGQYRVVAGWNAPDHISEIYDNIPFTSWPWGLTGTPVTVAADLTATANVELARSGKIRGTVTDAASSEPLAGQSVCIWHSWAFTCGTTGEDGVYTIASLPEGQYPVFVNGTSGYGPTYYDGIPSYGGSVPPGTTKVTVTAGNVTDFIDFALHAGARIEGTVVDEGTSSPLPNVVVTAYSEFGQSLTSGRTDANGHYVLGGLGAGTYHLRTNNADGYVNECLGGTECPVLQAADAYFSMGSPDFIAGTAVVLAANDTASNAHFTLAKAGRISGRLTDAQGRGISGGVAVFDGARRKVATATNLGNGNYVTAQGLPAGQYYVLASGAQFVAEVYDDKTCLGCSPTSGTPVAVTPGQTTADIDFVLARGGQIAGRIYDEGTGKGFPVVVEVWNASGVRINPDTAPAGDFSGGYATNGLPAGTYYVRTDNWSGYVDEAYGDAVCTKAGTPVGTQAVQVTEGTVTWGVDFGLARGAHVTGAVRNSAGEPVGGTQGQIYDAEGGFVTHWGTDPLGRYVPFNGLAPGTYHARTRNLGDYFDEVYSGKPCLDGCDLAAGDPIVVTGTDIGAVDFVLWSAAEPPPTVIPQLDSVTPPNGPAAGGNTVVLAGANFLEGTEVRFGETASTTVFVDSAFQIRAQAPSGTPGTVDVTVETPGGATATLPSAYQYLADTSPPVFTTPLYVASEALTGSPKTVTLTLKWVTNEEATTRLDYGMGSLTSWSENPGYGTSHAVTLTGLSPGQTYLFQATSMDLAGNTTVKPTPPLEHLTKAPASPPDTTAPVITNVEVTATETAATIVWETNEDATSLVQFDDSVNGTLTKQQQVSGTRQNHSVTLASLRRNTTYEFRVLSGDASGNGPTVVLPSPPYRTFTTACTALPPVISNLAVSYLSSDLVIISWTTNELATSWVNYGTSSVSEQGVMDVSLVTEHIVFLTNLAEGQCYGFQVGSTNACGHTDYTDDPFEGGNPCAAGPGPTGAQGVSLRQLPQPLRVGVATLAAGTTVATSPAAPGFWTPTTPDETGPAVTAGPTVTVLASDRVQVTLGTDEAASIRTRYGIAVVGEASAFDPTFTQTPSLILVGLRADTTYHLELVLTDPKGNSTAVSGLTFHTPTAPDTQAPTLSGLAVGSITQTSATVSWQTDEPAESWVRFGPEGGSLAGTASVPGLNSSHSIPLTGLAKGTTYVFQAASRDASGNVTTPPATGSFRTDYAPPAITGVTPDRGAQGTALTIVISGSRFDAGATVDLGSLVTVNSRTVDAAGTRIVANVTVDGTATAGPRQLRVTNPQSGLSASAVFTVEYMALTVDDTLVTEGDAGATQALFNLHLPAKSAQDVTVHYETVDGSAKAGVDYVAGHGTLTIQAGSTGGSIAIGVIGDLVDEPDETFFVNLSSPVNATLPDTLAQATILDDDVGASLSVSDASVTEGDSGRLTAVFTVTLTSVATVKVKVRYATQHISTTNQDLDPTSGQLVFQPGQTTTTVAVPVKGDLLDEDDETFLVRLSGAEGAPIGDGEGVGTILDDDPLPSLRVADVVVTERDTGTMNATFVVSLSTKSGRSVTVDYATGDGTALAGTDYVTKSGTLTFAPGETSKGVPVAVRGDRLREGTETFYLNLNRAVNATVADAQGVGTIKDND